MTLLDYVRSMDSVTLLKFKAYLRGLPTGIPTYTLGMQAVIQVEAEQQSKRLGL